MIIQQFSLIEWDGQGLSLPKDSKVLTVDVLDQHPFIWILLDESQPEQEIRIFKVLRTQEIIREHFKSYLCSLKNTHQTEMLHVFEM